MTEKKDEAAEVLKKAILDKADSLGMRLATDEEMKAIVEDGKEAYERIQAEMDKPDYDAKYKLLRDNWYRRANDREMSLKTLPSFLAELAEHQHDYNTIVVAVTAAAMAAARSLDRSPNGGITGFQASAVFWEFYREWLQKNGPACMVDYSTMLYPQYEYHFQKTITSDTWKWLQTEAAKNIAKEPDAHDKVAKHWRSIVDGRVPFGFIVSDDN